MLPSERIQLLLLLLARLERVSVDSYWAHRSSGLRGSLLRAVEKLEQGQPIDEELLRNRLDEAFDILERAAQERSR